MKDLVKKGLAAGVGGYGPLILYQQQDGQQDVQ